MGVASSQTSQLKLFNSTVDKHQELDNQFEIENGKKLETQKAQSRILVSINKDNTVRISEGKCIATQTPREGYQVPEEKNIVGAREEQNAIDDKSVTKDKIHRYAQTDDSFTENRKGYHGHTLDASGIVPPLNFNDKSSNNFESTDVQEDKGDTCIFRGVNMVESENEAGETDYWTDVGIQTDTDFENDNLEPKIAWGSNSVDSAITLQQNLKEANSQEEKEKDTQSDVETPIPARHFEELSLDRYGKYKVRLSSDKEKCIIYSATFLETGDAVVIDRSNMKIKFVDKKFQFISSHELSAVPWAVCARGVDVYVTIGNRIIQHLTVEDMIIEPVEQFEIKGRCLGICVYDGKLAVGLQVGEVCLLDFKGNKQGTIRLPKVDGKPCNPWHLSVSAEDNLIVTDSGAESVYCVNRKSEVIFSFKELGLPRGTCVDSAGNILVVGRNKETDAVVSILHRDIELQHMLHIEQQIEKKSRVLMTWKELEFVPYCICYRPDRIVVLGGIQEALKIMKIR